MRASGAASLTVGPGGNRRRRQAAALLRRLERANRREARRKIRKVVGDRRREQLPERVEQALHRLRARIEILAHPRLRGTQVGLVRRFLPAEDRRARRQQAQAQVLAKEVCLVGRDQRRGRPVADLEPHQRAQLLNDLSERAPPWRLALNRRLWFRRRQALVLRERQRIDLRDRLVELQRDRRQVDERQRLQPIDVARQRATQRSQRRTVDPRELAVGELKRRQRRGNVAGQRELLVGYQQDLLDLVQRNVVARRREIAVQRLQRRLLRLRFREPRLEQRDLRLRFAQLAGEHAFPLARLRRRDLGRRQPPRGL